MCTVSININEATMLRIDPRLTSQQSISSWLQRQVDLMLEEMAHNMTVNQDVMDSDEGIMDPETARGMIHKTIKKEYACDKTERQREALKKDMTPEQLYSLIVEEIGNISPTPSRATP